MNWRNLCGCFIILIITALRVSDGQALGKKKVCIKLVVDNAYSKVAVKGSDGDYVKIAQVEVIQQLSKHKCVRHQTYAYRGPHLLTRGCKALFQVCYWEENYDESGCHTMKLYSKINLSHRKIVPGGPVVRMKVRKQFKDSTSCERGRSFGFYKNVVFAKFGCRAEFLVCVQKKLVGKK
ncbi:hypothetical protein Btru_000887 [Bulinus truncatus]|nr:hypothetical protein Btru_000887 [Bulinus truncatus]